MATVVSTTDDGRRLIAVLHGLTSMSERAEEARKLITWGMRGFELIPVFPKGKIVAYANVYGGDKPQVGLVGKGKIDLFVPKGASNCPEATVTYRGPLRPPVRAGTEIGQAQRDLRRQGGAADPALCRRDRRRGRFVRKFDRRAQATCLGWLPTDAAIATPAPRGPLHHLRRRRGRRQIHAGQAPGRIARAARRSPPCARASRAARPRPRPSARSSCRAARRAGGRGPRRCCSPPPGSTTSTS